MNSNSANMIRRRTRRHLPGFRSFLSTATLHLLFAGGFVSVASADDVVQPSSDTTRGSPGRRIVVTQTPIGLNGPQAPGYSVQSTGTLVSGSRVVLVDFSGPDKQTRDLAQGFDAAGRPDVSFDGRRVLFVGRRTRTDPFSVWEVQIDGEGLREVVRPPRDCDRAIYLPTLYTLDADRPEYQICFAADAASGPPALFTCRLDGSQLRQITFAASPIDQFRLVDDGRLMFSLQRHGEFGLIQQSTRNLPQPGTDFANTFAIHTDGADITAATLNFDAAPKAADAARQLDTPGWHVSDVVAVRPRPVPAGRSSVIKDNQATGRLYCLNANLTQVDSGSHAGKGMASALRVFRASGDGVGIGAPGSEVLLGEIPIESDGSFQVVVPARTALRLETIDADGRVIQAMKNWIWVIPGESRGCIGCHEDRLLTPPNRFAKALRNPPHRMLQAIEHAPATADDGSSAAHGTAPEHSGMRH